MKIEKMEIYTIRCPLKETFWTANSRINNIVESLVKVYTDEGIIGIGKSNGDPEIMEKGLKSLILGKNPFQVEMIWNKMFSLTYDGRLTRREWTPPKVIASIAAIDIALWDIIGKATGKTVCELLGGYKKGVPTYATGGYYQEKKDVQMLVEEQQIYVEKYGYKAVKIKVGRVPLKEDTQRIEAVRKALGDDIDIMLDANQGWAVDRAIEAARVFEPLGIRWLEEPVHWYDCVDGLAKVGRSTNLTIASGERELTRFGCRNLLQRGDIDILQFDATRGGGVTEWRKVAAIADAHNIWMAPHHDPQIHVHLVGAVPNGLILESFPNPERDPLWQKLYSKGAEIKGGYCAVPDRPGFGIEIDEKSLQKYGTKVSS